MDKRRWKLTLALVVLTTSSLLFETPSHAKTKCTRKAATGVIHQFERAYNGGNIKRLNSLWAPEPSFRWYQVGPTLERIDREDRTSLIAYFRQRHENEDRLHFIRLRVRKTPSWHGGFDFSFFLYRESADPVLIREGAFDGKGAVSSRCQLFVWSMSRRL